MINEIVIVGAGPAGLSCASYLNRLGLNCTIVSDYIGGKLNFYENIKGFFPYNSIKTVDFIDLMQDNLRKSIAETRMEPTFISKKVQKIERIEDGTYQIIFNDQTYIFGKVVIIATGTKPHIPEIIKKKANLKYYTFEDYPFSHLVRTDRVVLLGAGNTSFTVISSIEKNVRNIVVLDINDRNFSNLPISKKKELESLKNCSFVFNKDYNIQPNIISYFALGKEMFIEYDKLILCTGEQVTTFFLPEYLKDHCSGRIKVYNNYSDKFINMSLVWKGMFAIGDAKNDQFTSNISYAVADGMRTAICVKEYLYGNGSN